MHLRCTFRMYLECSHLLAVARNITVPIFTILKADGCNLHTSKFSKLSARIGFKFHIWSTGIFPFEGCSLLILYSQNSQLTLASNFLHAEYYFYCKHNKHVFSVVKNATIFQHLNCYLISLWLTAEDPEPSSPQLKIKIGRKFDIDHIPWSEV